MRRALLLAGQFVILSLAGPCLAQDIDCRVCHGPEPRPEGAADFSAYYIEGARHHPVGVAVPAGGGYVLPQRAADGTAFFDSNGDGLLDIDELRLSSSGTVECLSCHREHEAAQEVAGPAAYLRRDNRDSALCRVCHRL